MSSRLDRATYNADLSDLKSILVMINDKYKVNWQMDYFVEIYDGFEDLYGPDREKFLTFVCQKAEQKVENEQRADKGFQS